VRLSPRAEALVARLGLLPHPEGGFYRELHRSLQRVLRAGDERSALTSIYFLLAAGQHGRWHVVRSDEAWHHLAGDPLELLSYEPTTALLERHRLGAVDADGCSPFAVVPAQRWQAARPLGDFALAGCTVGPGFEFADFRFVADLPAHARAFDSALAAYRTLL
jgi:predicted cupin superfamily sugar epimerase